jgi:hypothetical protein
MTAKINLLHIKENEIHCNITVIFRLFGAGNSLTYTDLIF